MRLHLKKTAVEIIFPCGSIAKIDREDLLLFAQHKWYVAKTDGQVKYLKTNILDEDGKRTTTCLHRMLLERSEGKEIDHINRDGLDNRKSNLRLVTHQQNQTNRSKSKESTSRYYGVHYDKIRNKWQAQVRLQGKAKNIGRFETEAEAAQFRELYIIQNGLSQLHRNFSYANF